ncbi:MAG: hypothetical protein AAF488_01280 [Planctomycetota bacterium]
MTIELLSARALSRYSRVVLRCGFAAVLSLGVVGCGTLEFGGPRLELTVHEIESEWGRAAIGAKLLSGVALVGSMTETSWIERVVCEVGGVSVEATLICAIGGDELTMQSVTDLGATDWIVVSSQERKQPRVARVEKSSTDLPESVIRSIANVHGAWTDLNAATVEWPRRWARATVASEEERGWSTSGLWVGPESLFRFREVPRTPLPGESGEVPTVAEYRVDRVVDGVWRSTMLWSEVTPGAFTVIGRDPEYRLEVRRVSADGSGS